MLATPKTAPTARLVASSSRSLARFLVAFAVLVVSLFAARRADAYPWMIRHDYATCATCHADPSGAGIMTAYGRAQGEILMRMHYGESSEDEDPAKLGNFLFGAVSLPEQLQLQADGRALYLHQAFLPSQPSVKAVDRVILMQADTAASISAGRFRASGSLGYIHEGALAASVTHGNGIGGDGDRLISRQHWLGVSLGKDDEFLLRAGRMNLPFGLRVLEHTLLTRQATHTDINAAQQHGVAFSWNKEGWRAEIMAIAGNYQLAPDALRDRGGTAYIEHSFSQKLALGLSSMITHADHDLETGRATFRQNHGLFGRWAIAKPVVLLAEADVLGLSPIKQKIQIGTTGFAQVDVEPIQGLHFAGTGEYLAMDLANPSTSYGGWLSAFWFFLPHMDVRSDFVARNVGAPGSDRQTALTYLLQLHGYL
jgi:hypothetical protein